MKARHTPTVAALRKPPTIAITADTVRTAHGNTLRSTPRHSEAVVSS